MILLVSVILERSESVIYHSVIYILVVRDNHTEDKKTSHIQIFSHQIIVLLLAMEPRSSVLPENHHQSVV